MKTVPQTNVPNGLISVIVPVYKAEKYLRRCVDSILGQTYKNLEVILVDDGSPDNSGAICDEYASRDSRVKVIHKENGGVSSARNSGLDIASGDYITFVDSDDYIEAEMYEEMYEKAGEYNCDVVMCDCIKEGKSSILYTHDIRAGFYDVTQLEKEYYPHLLMMENLEYPPTISNYTLLFKSVLAKGIRYPVGIRFSEDLLFGAKIMYSATSFYYMKNEAYYHYVLRGSSASHTIAADKWDDYVLLYQEIQKSFGSCTKYDFSSQIDLALLFFVNNAVNEIYESGFSVKEKKAKIDLILQEPVTREMFRRLRVCALHVSLKLRIINLAYKYRVGIFSLIIYYKDRKK